MTYPIDDLALRIASEVESAPEDAFERLLAVVKKGQPDNARRADER